MSRVMRCATPRALMLLMMIGVLSACSDGGGGEVVDDVNDGFVGDGCGTDFDCDLGKFCIRNECRLPGDECQGDGDCQGELICRQGYCVERSVGCGEDGDCEQGEICDDGACRIGCREDGDCSEDRACDLEELVCFTPVEDCGGCPMHTRCDRGSGECLPDGTCTEDVHCPDQQTCINTVCRNEGQDCSRNVDCPDGTFCNRESASCEVGCRLSNECRIEQVCVLGACTEPPPCEPDALEPDNSPQEATGLLPVQTFEGLTICEDDDWFRFTAFEGDELSLSLSFIHDFGNINMQIYDPNDEPLQLSAGSNDGEQLTRTMEMTGVYTLRVFGATRGVFTTYDMDIAIERNCTEDDSEDNDSPEQAVEVDPLLEPLADRFICGADDDWYAVDLYPGETLEAALRFEHALGNLALELYDDEATLIEAVDTQDDDEVVSLLATEARRVLLRVPGDEAVVNRYALEAAVVIPECADEADGDDDTPEGAVSAAPGDVIEGRICSGDEDWVALLLPADVPLAVTLAHDPSQGELELTLLGPDGQTLQASGQATPEGASLELLTETAGVTYLRIKGQGRAQNSYALTIEGGPEATCEGDDRFEDNDAFEAPAALEQGRVGDLILCEGDDEDWFSFGLEAGQSVEIFVLTVAEVGQVSVDLFGARAADDAARPLDSARGPESLKRVRAQVGVPPGTLRLRVTREDGQAVPYSVRMTIYDGPLPLSCEFDDEFEPNGVVSDAARLEYRATREGIICGSDVDWFRFDAEAGDVVSVRADYAMRDGDVNVILHGGMPLTPLFQALSEDDHEFIRHRVREDGPLFLEVKTAAPVPEGAVYGLTISRQAGPVAQSCVTDDIHEQNDSFADATELSQGTISGIHCTEDDDYFALTLPAGHTLNAELLYQGDEELELVVLAVDQVRLAEAARVPTSARTVSYTAGVAEVELALVILSDGPVDAAYTLNWEVLPEVPERCGEDDASEPDDDATVATEVEVGTELTGLTLCGVDEDWYRLTVPAGQRLIVEATFDPLLGNLELEAIEQGGGGLAASFSTIGTERIELRPATEARTLYVRAFLDGAPQESLGYDLRFAFDNVIQCFPDANEDNNSRGAATRIAPGFQDNLSICPDDQDWYRVEVDLFETVTATIEFDGEEADLDMALFDGALNVEVARSAGLGNRETVQGLGIIPGPFFIQVYSADQNATDYTLRVTVQ